MSPRCLFRVEGVSLAPSAVEEHAASAHDDRHILCVPLADEARAFRASIAFICFSQGKILADATRGYASLPHASVGLGAAEWHFRCMFAYSMAIHLARSPAAGPHLQIPCRSGAATALAEEIGASFDGHGP